MKLTNLVASILLVLLASCSKQETTLLKFDRSLAIVVNPAEGDGVPVSGATAATFLAAKTWVLFEQFNNYSSGTPSVVFKYNRSSNSTVANLQSRLNFTQSGTSSQTGTYTVKNAAGTTVVDQGTWSLTTTSGLHVVSMISTSIANLKHTFDLQVVDSYNLTVYDEVSNSYSVFYSSTNVPGNNSTSTTAAMLTAGGWKYKNYYENYLTVPCTLAYRENRISPVTALPASSSKFGFYYRFAADGTYTQITYTTTSVYTYGVWTLTDNNTKLHLQNTTVPSTPEVIYNIALLTDQTPRRFEFSDASNGNLYSEMINNSGIY
ncbi:hypothetical protein [[Flexibacter] sp. ATCC 35208]|uniref:hypothetical protein n=1 Tax=[Flexibacter] sp. ATCC 35208 TaxID=1936242 RepID=UPI0009CD6A1B|nr:hypothetical protein [[Flexibacter] sp. ATCC 35208]OMP74514.1 hypothetical protein BW716_34960 [[Flexibacter] sp. ATCC 35208]